MLFAEIPCTPQGKKARQKIWSPKQSNIIQPSGHHSVTVLDYLKYLQLNLNGLTGHDNYLKSKTYDFIFNGAKEYSMGWGNDMVNGNHYYSHSGSVGNFEARAIIMKEARVVIFIMLNAGNGETIGGMHQIIKYLEKKYAT